MNTDKYGSILADDNSLTDVTPKQFYCPPPMGCPRILRDRHGGYYFVGKRMRRLPPPFTSAVASDEAVIQLPDKFVAAFIAELAQKR